MGNKAFDCDGFKARVHPNVAFFAAKSGFNKIISFTFTGSPLRRFKIPSLINYSVP